MLLNKNENPVMVKKSFVTIRYNLLPIGIIIIIMVMVVVEVVVVVVVNREMRNDRKTIFTSSIVFMLSR
jgi:hypothetical protein